MGVTMSQNDDTRLYRGGFRTYATSPANRKKRAFALTIFCAICVLALANTPAMNTYQSDWYDHDTKAMFVLAVVVYWYATNKSIFAPFKWFASAVIWLLTSIFCLWVTATYWLSPMSWVRALFGRGRIYNQSYANIGAYNAQFEKNATARETLDETTNEVSEMEVESNIPMPPKKVVVVKSKRKINLEPEITGENAVMRAGELPEPVQMPVNQPPVTVRSQVQTPVNTVNANSNTNATAVKTKPVTIPSQAPMFEIKRPLEILNEPAPF